MTQYPLGRRHAPDPHDAAYPLAALLPADALVPSYRYWSGFRTHLNQTGDTCVSNAWTHLITDSPRSHLLADLDADKPGWPGGWTSAYTDPQSGEHGFRGWLYGRSQATDEFSDTPPSGGTSVRAAAKVLQGIGVISAYHWAQSMDDVCTAVLTAGPLVVGTRWTEDMFTPQGSTCLVHPTGVVKGGHAWKVDGYSRTTRVFRAKNSWSAAWGCNSYFRIGYDDLEQLLFGFGDGEACMPVEA